MSNVLIVDDSPSMRQLIAATLQHAGHEVVQAEDGVAALSIAAEQSFDLVISDVHMPNMDGLTLLGKLRELTSTRFTPILMLTTEIDAKFKAEAKQKGATGWMNKPVDEERLLATIERVLA